MANPYTRANFRVGQSQIALGALTSHIAVISTSGTTDGSGILTISMGGAGAPSMWIGGIILSIPIPPSANSAGVWILLTPTQSFSGSIGWIMLLASGLPASGAIFRALMTALIGSVF